MCHLLSPHPDQFVDCGCKNTAVVAIDNAVAACKPSIWASKPAGCEFRDGDGEENGLTFERDVKQDLGRRG